MVTTIQKRIKEFNYSTSGEKKMYGKEGLREDASVDKEVERTDTGPLSEAGQQSKARRAAYTRLLMNQLGLSLGDAEDLYDNLGADKVIKMFASPRKTEDIESDFKSLKDSLMGVGESKKKQRSLGQQIEDLE